MVSGVKRIRVSGVALCVLLAGAADATIQTKTVTGSNQGFASMALFDPTLGNLLSVYAEASYTSWQPYSSYVAPVGYDQAVSGTATIGNLTFAINGTSQAAQQSGNWGIFTVTANGTATWSNPTAIALFTGASGNILGYAGASAPMPGTMISGNYVPTVNYKLTYTYDNSPAVPEPATWAMMVGGFVLLGTALRVARRNRPETDAAEA